MKTYLLASLVGFIVSFIFCLVAIPILKRLKAGQNILGYVKEHYGKSGTPTMGGVAFLLAAFLVTLIFGGYADRRTLVCIAISFAFMLVGFLDDLLKKVHNENLGLTAMQKSLFQLCVAVIACVYLFLNGNTELYLPFTLKVIDVGMFMIPLGVFVFVATVNSVNLTDGLDGLASATCIPFFLGLGAITVLEGQSGSIPLYCFVLTGSLLAYLIFNVQKASIFMGDTGSLGLGGAVSSCSLLSKNTLYVPILGCMFVLSSISVMLQVIYYKKTGKRVFKMAPIHHHFEMSGKSESKIAYCYFCITLIASFICILFLM